MRPDHQEIAEGLKMAAVAAISAVLTATVVIGASRAVLHNPGAAAAAERPELIRVTTR